MASSSTGPRLAPQKEAVSDIFSKFESSEIERLGEALLHDNRAHHRSLDFNVCVWPPVLVGKRARLILEEGELQEDLCLGRYIKGVLQREQWSGRTGSIHFYSLHSCIDVEKRCPLFVFPSTCVDGYLAVRHMERVWSNLQDKEVERFRNAGWTLKYATVGDMVESDPHRKLVDWIPLKSSVEHDLKSDDSFQEIMPNSKVNLNNVVYKQFLSPILKTGGVFERLRDLLTAKHASLRNDREELKTAKRFSHEFEGLGQEGFTRPIQKFLACVDEKESLLREVFECHDLQDGKALSQRFKSLAEMMRVPVKARKTLTSKMVNQGVELELRIFRLMALEIRHGKKYDDRLRKVKEERVASARQLVEKLKTEMMELLTKSSAESKSILEAKLFSQLQMVKDIRSSKEEVFALTKFLSTGTTLEIAEHIYKDALKERDLHHAQKREMQEQKLKSTHQDLTILSGKLKELRKAKSNQECCICYDELEGFTIPNGHRESSYSSQKVHRRACFLPCMHANVCTTCCENRWNEGPQLCPICCQQLTEKPRVIYL